jgi:ubiquinone/menaquinone biosynthesis C-methylase UbiE
MSNKKDEILSLEKSLKSELYERIPGYNFSNDVFENWIKESLKKDSVWIDAGCGSNYLTEEFSIYSKSGTGVDMTVHPELKNAGKFLKADLAKLPFENESVDVIVSNMVVEHLENPRSVLSEFYRILKPGGNFIFRTTNKYYPTQFFGHLFSKKTKDRIINRVFGVESHDIFSTHYRLNSLKKIKKILPAHGFSIHRLEAIEDLHLFNKFVFRVSCFFYRIQKLKPFYFLRNTLVCWVKKSV